MRWRRCLVLAAVLLCVHASLGEADRDSLSRLQQQVLELYGQQRYTEGIEVAKTWVVVASRQHGQTSEQAAAALGSLGALYRAQGHALAEQAAEIRLRLGLGGTPPGMESELLFPEAGGRKGRSLADLDGNGRCDEADRARFEEHFGSCGRTPPQP